MTQTAPAPVTVDPAIALADALQTGFAAQRSGHQRTRIPVARPATR